MQNQSATGLFIFSRFIILYRTKKVPQGCTQTAESPSLRLGRLTGDKIFAPLREILLKIHTGSNTTNQEVITVPDQPIGNLVAVGRILGTGIVDHCPISRR